MVWPITWRRTSGDTKRDFLSYVVLPTSEHWRWVVVLDQPNEGLVLLILDYVELLERKTQHTAESNEHMCLAWMLVAPYKGHSSVCLYCGNGKGRKCIRWKYFHSSIGHYRPLLSHSQGTAPSCLLLEKLTYVTSC